VVSQGASSADEVAGSGPATSRSPTLQEARALAHPLRLRILRLCLDDGLTNNELSAALGERPATVLHHVRTLVATGFLAEEAWRRGPRGSTEKPYRATGKSWQLDHAMSGDANLKAVLEAVAAEVHEAGPDAVIEGARMAMRLRPDQLDELVGQIQRLIENYPGPGEYLATEDTGGDPYALLVVLHRRRAATDSHDNEAQEPHGSSPAPLDGPSRS
jgi:DNA-binding transcriptional ArsR family regulator